MKLGSFVSFAGFVMLIAATYCPLFSPFGIVKWDMYKANMPYGIVVLLVAMVGIVGVIFMQYKLVRLTSWLSIALVIFFYVLSLLKIHYSFNFIPFHFLQKLLGKLIKFKWGWWLLCAGPVLSVIGVLVEKPKFKMPEQQKAVANTAKQG